MKYEYQLLLLEPDVRRAERINVGVIVYLEEGIDIRLPASLAKLRALDPAFTPRVVEQAKETIVELATVDQEAFKNASGHLGALHTGKTGWFIAESKEDYEAHLTNILNDLVMPPRRKTKRPRTSRLAGALKKDFTSKGWIGKVADDINRHLILPQFLISEEEGLKADFAFKNGVYHVTTVADLRAESLSFADMQRKGAIKAITMNEARRKLDGSKSYSIFAAKSSDEIKLQPVIAMLGEYSEGNVFNYLSADDMQAYHSLVAEKLNRPTLH